MLTAISRYGARVLPITEELVAGCKARGEFIQGPQIAEFEAAFAARHGLGPAHAIAAAYGRIAFYYMLKALDLPPGSEIIFPSLTFWVVPELARVAGLTVVFADVDPTTFNMDPDSVERLITDKTRAIVPTHLYGLPCDMDRIMAIAAKHDLVVLEDCAHALGATYKGKPVGTFGAGALFSFQTLKPLNCYGGGLALVNDAALAAKVRALVEALPWPSEKRVTERLLMGRLQRIFMKPWVFSISLFPVLWVSALIDANPDVFFWEKIRSLHPLPEQYTERFPNVQAVIGLEALKHLDEWTAQAQANAAIMNRTLSGIPGIQLPLAPADRTHVYYQYCVIGPDGPKRDELVVRCVRRGIDIETLHVDVPPDMELFGTVTAEADGARRAAQAMQVPVHSGLRRDQIERVARVVRSVLEHASVLPYLAIVAFAVLEGEIYYSKVCADAMVGKLNWVGVWCAGAIGGSLGDQIWFYLLRGRIHWLDRFPKLAKYRDRVSAHVQAHEALIILSGRFLPGLRTAIPVACAYADVPPLKFTALNLVSGFAWAGSIMLFVKLGSNALSAFGLNAWWGPLIPAVLVILFFRWLSLPRRSS